MKRVSLLSTQILFSIDCNRAINYFPPLQWGGLLLKGYMNSYKIISINGGGIKGILAARLLERLNEAYPLIDKTELYAGVSTGGLISLALAYGLDLNAIKNLYLKECKTIFRDTFWDDVEDLFGVAGADYDIRNLETVLRKYFGSTRVSELRKKVLVTTFDLDNEDPDSGKRSWSPLIISNLNEKYNGNNYYVFESGCCTAAAPVFFNSYNGIVDGGIVNSNCSMDAVCAVLDSSSEGPKVKRDEILLLNIGTGISPKYIEGKNIDHGYAGWMKNIVPAMMDGDDFAIDNQCRELLGDNYFRINPVFPEDVDIPMDAVDKLYYLLQVADSVCIAPALKWLKEKWK